MKILHVIPSLNIGGTEKMLLELCRGLKDKGFESHVVALKGGGRASDELKKAGIPVFLLNSPDGFLAGTLDFIPLCFRLKREVRKISPDILHAWLTRANVIGRLVGRLSGVPVIVSSLRVMEEEKSYHRTAERLTQRWTDWVTVNCSALQTFAVNRIGLAREKIVVIPNGIDTSVPVPGPGAIARQEGEFLIGTIGRLHRQKGMDVLLKAFKTVLSQAPGCRLLIAGDGPEQEALQSLARELGVALRVTFCGWTKESLPFLASLDLCVFPSRWEGMPNAVMEAMFVKKPIVATSVGGTSDLIRDGVDGRLIPAEDVEACAVGLISMVQNEEDRKKMAQSASERIRSQFGLTNMVASYKDFYEKIAG